ncbi:hypothetical protein [Rathayibacter sp. VKM Ac-2630]|uniref:hypothetical protein n=1 Tax=Rathayibacter sp. VKM Ac-2630 TaxID=1938617 RepID=UPI0009819983|nr:hypothetical protein [Rathayibacter sp. VKM Ac-2630]OOB90751.1 hypothetical protein B0T42_10110 [Rathayibacter sp. VKM Ac-2630]
MWTHTLHAPGTGNLIAPVELAKSSSKRRLNAPSTGTHSVIASDDFEWSALLCSPWEVIVATAWNGVCLYAGYLENVTDWNEKTRELTFSTLDVRGAYMVRPVFRANAEDYRAADLTITDRSYSGAVRAVIERVLHGNTGGWQLPIITPPDAGGPVSAFYPYWDLWTAEKALAEMQDRDDGPDLDFAPRYRADGGLEWVVRVGTPRLSGPEVEVNLGSQENGLSTASFRINGQMQRTGEIAVGNGSEADMLVAFANNLDGPAMPFRDSIESGYKSITDPGVLLGHAYSDLRAYRYPTEQWSYALQANTPGADLETLTLGSHLGVWTVGHPKYTDGWRDTYLIGFDTDLTETVSLAVQPYWEP